MYASWGFQRCRAAIMQGNRRRDTHTEVGVRAAWRVPPSSGIGSTRDRSVTDVRRQTSLFTRVRVAVLIEGSYWHCCPEHFKMPSTNRSQWEVKIGRNWLPDIEATASLEERGWRVLRFWEHEAAHFYRRQHGGHRARSTRGHSLRADRLSTQSSLIVWIGASRSGKSLCRAIREVSP